MVSEKLQKWHDENCPSIDINSVDFTHFLIEELAKLKAEVGGIL